MKTEIICSGFGGQGVLTTGLILADSFTESGKNLTWIPSYSSEMRGGVANCFIKIGDEEIYSPYVKNPDVLIALNEKAIDTYEAAIKKGGFLFVNSSIVSEERSYRDDIQVLKVPMTEIALENQNPKGANLVLLGAFVEKTKTSSVEEFRDNINKFFAKKGKYNEKNGICFDAGVEFARNN